jgi:hypothetical protein
MKSITLICKKTFKPKDFNLDELFKLFIQSPFYSDYLKNDQNRLLTFLFAFIYDNLGYYIDILERDYELEIENYFNSYLENHGRTTNTHNNQKS